MDRRIKAQNSPKGAGLPVYRLKQFPRQTNHPRNGVKIVAKRRGEKAKIGTVEFSRNSSQENKSIEVASHRNHLQKEDKNNSFIDYSLDSKPNTIILFNNSVVNTGSTMIVSSTKNETSKKLQGKLLAQPQIDYKKSKNLYSSELKHSPVPIDKPSGSPKSKEKKGAFMLLLDPKREGSKVSQSVQRAEVPQFSEEGLKPAQVLRHYKDQLSDYELGEILDVPTVYYIGEGVSNKICSRSADKNFGFDDDKGYYHVVVKDHIAYRYEVLHYVGKGAFGQVMQCYDHKEKRVVAIKIIKNKKKLQHQATVEVKILKYIKEHDTEEKSCIISIYDYFVFRRHICITFELLSINLYDFLKSNNFKGLSMGLIRRFAIQLLNSLYFLREHQIIHCDLKPENILLKQPNRSDIRLIDFGSSCFSNEKIYTYIQSRFYRAPDIMLGVPYTTAIDMWSLGCILAELYTGYPLFPGESEPEQMAMIMEINGAPPKEILEKACRRKVFFDASFAPILTPNSKGRVRTPGSRTLRDILKTNDEDFVDFIQQCIKWDPETRLRPDEARQHKWITSSSPLRSFGQFSRNRTGVYAIATEPEEEKFNVKKNMSFRIKQLEQLYSSKDATKKKIALESTNVNLADTLNHSNINLNSSFATAGTQGMTTHTSNTPKNAQANHGLHLRERISLLKDRIRRSGESGTISGSKNPQASKTPTRKKGALCLHVMNRRVLPPIITDLNSSPT